MDGTVLCHAEMDYGDLKDIGRVVIEMDGNWKVRVTVDGFTFESKNGCRPHVTKAMAWARDVLATAVEADRLIPGGHLVSCSGIDQEDLKAEKPQ